MNFLRRTGSLLTALAALGLAAALPAQAEVIVFDDLTDNGGFSGTPIPNGYHGFNWNNFYILNSAVSALGGPNGYTAGTVSPPNVAYNGFGAPASFQTLASPFTLHSAYFTGAFNDGLTISVQGLDSSNTVIDSTSFVVSSTAPSLETFNWSGLSGVNVSTSGGTPHVGYAGGGTQFALDNLTVTPDTAASPAPEPAQTASLVFVGLGLGGVVLMARKKKAQNPA